MSIAKKTSGIALAAAAAAIFSVAPIASHAASDTDATVKCLGANACKGQSACATASSNCAGLNACKGQGWVKLSAPDCASKGGKPADS